MFTLTIETDNEAFTGDPAPELARILRKVAKRLESGLDAGADSFTIMDVNGNSVGKAELTA